MKLIDWLNKSGKSAKECATFLGISEPAFSAYVNGKTLPRLAVALRIVEDLTNGGVSYRDLLLVNVRRVEEDEL